MGSWFVLEVEIPHFCLGICGAMDYIDFIIAATCAKKYQYDPQGMIVPAKPRLVALHRHVDIGAARTRPSRLFPERGVCHNNGMTEDAHDSQQIWDAVGPVYLTRQAPDDATISYGPWAPPETELRLLGDVREMRVLDLGCGGGHNAVALARRGAQVTGIDVSAQMIEHARARAAAANVGVTFLQGDMTALHATGPEQEQKAEPWDLILSVATFHYIRHIDPVLAVCAQRLQPGGRLVFSVDHPLRNCFFDADEEDLAVMPVRGYFDATPMRWIFPETTVPLRSYPRPVSAWTDAVTAAGLRLQRLVEPPPPAEMLDATWPEDGALAPLRYLPQVLIIAAARE